MTKRKLLTEFQPGRGYGEGDWKAVESPELTDEELASGRPFAEAFPEMAAKMRPGRGPARKPKKQHISIRLDTSVIEAFKSEGPGWQARINATLVAEVARRKKAG